ncbi:MAG: stage III sporulation protein AF [Clostridia bacterium]|nr:stage III sporulation protein AF [Clostridia bacterium]
MEKWLISILIFSIAMTLILRVLPENSIKKTVHISFGIIFLLAISGPVLNLFSNGLNSDGINRFFEEKISEIDEEDDDKYVETVLAEYSDSICELAKDRIYDETGMSCEVSVSVCDDVSSSLFGNVLNVKCNVVSHKENGQAQSEIENNILTDIPLVEDIVISFNTAKEETQIDEGAVISVLTELFGVSSDQCEIYIDEK